MEKRNLTRSYLETLSTADLVEMADDHGIDIPEGLNRRFIIGELLELDEQLRQEDLENAILVDTDYTVRAEELPETYNETSITLLMRDPGWVFAYWDFHSNLYTAITSNFRFESFFLRVNTLSDTTHSSVIDYFDIEVGNRDRKWYIHLSSRDHACRVDLYSRNVQEKEQLLARSGILVIPPTASGDLFFSQKRRNPPLIELSGIQELRKYHFINHRQSFS